jgi:hypothetical protein
MSDSADRAHAAIIAKAAKAGKTAAHLQKKIVHHKPKPQLHKQHREDQQAAVDKSRKQHKTGRRLRRSRGAP